MKKNCFSFVRHLLLGAGCVMAVSTLTSCYSTTVSVGDMKPTDPATCVATTHEAHFISGLIGSPKRDAKNYVGENKDYRFRQYTSFVDGLLSSITLGIYSPTTTKYYLPYGVTAPKPVRTLPPVKFGLRGGLNFTSLAEGKNRYTSFDDATATTGFNIGAIVDIPISNSLYFQPGLYYSTKGANKLKTKERYLPYGAENKEFDASLSYIEIPLLFSYRYNLMDDIQLQGAAGPYAAFGVTGDIDGQAPFSSFAAILDSGLRFEAGVLYQKHYYAGVGYELGILSHTNIDGKTRNFFVNIGYNF